MTKKTLSKQLALAGWLSASTFIFQGNVLAANYGSLDSNSIALANGDVVTADNVFDLYLTGIYNNVNLTGSIDLGSGSKVIAKNNNTGSGSIGFSIGISLNGENTSLNANNLEINTKGTRSIGLQVEGKQNHVNLGTGGSINVEATSDGSYGMYVSKGSSVEANNIAINSTGKGFGVYVEKQGSVIDLGTGSSIMTNDGEGIQVSEGGRFTASELTVDTQGSSGYGVNVQSNSSVNLGTGSSVTTHGNYGTGVWVHGEFEANAVTITTNTSTAVALEVRSGGNAKVGANSHINAKKAGGLLARGNNAVADFKGSATERNTIFSGGDYAVSAQISGVVNVENTDMVVDRNGNDAYAIWAAGGVVNAHNITLAGANGVYGVVANSGGGKAYFTGETTITMADPNGIALISSGAGNLISVVGKMNITGAVMSEDNASTDLKMTQGSVLTGGVFFESGGATNLSLEGSQWNMTMDSEVSKLVLNNSNVNFVEDKTGSVLTVGDLSGNGTFYMETNVGEIKSDQLIITGTSAGNHKIKVKSVGSMATTGDEVLTVVQTTDGQAAFGMANNVDLGGYQYKLRKHVNNTDWELYSGGKLAPAADRTLSFLNTSYLLNYAETQTLLQRMGELRQSENSSGDVWARAFTGKFDSFGGGQLSGFDMDYTGVQVGADKRLDVSGGKLYLGVMGGTSKADTNYTDGDGDITGYHLGLYGSYVTANDFYVDGTLKYTHFKNKFNITASDKTRVNSDVESDGYGISLEAGKRFYFDPSKSGYYIEPQAQISYSRQGSASTTTSDGLNINMDSYDSTLSRVSAVLGYEVKNSQNPMNVYFKTGYVTEMSGDTNYSLNNSKEKYDFGGDWWENSIGITAEINKAHNLYLEGTYSSGSKFNQTQVNAGYRYSF